MVRTVRPEGNSLPVKLPTRATVGRAKLSGKTVTFFSTRGEGAATAGAAASNKAHDGARVEKRKRVKDKGEQEKETEEETKRR